MKNKSTQKETDTVKRKGISPFYSAVFFSRQANGLSARGARIFLSGRVAKIVNGIARSISYTSTRTFGCMAMAFGLISVFLHLGEYYFVDEPTVRLSTLIIGAVFALLSIPLVLFDIPMCTALQSFALTDYIFFEFFSIKRMHKNAKVRGIHPIIGALVGIIPATVGFFVPLEYVVLVFFTLLFVIVAFISPEFPFLFLLIMIPYISYIPYSTVLLVSLSLLALVSFLRKVFLGKRTYFLGISDIFLFTFALVIIITGAIGGGSTSTLNSWMLIALTFAYIPAANIIVNRRLADRAVTAIIFSALPTSAFAISDYIVNLVKGERTPSHSTMSSPEALAAFLSVTLIMLVFSVRDMKNSVKRGVYIAFSILCILAIATTECIPVLFLLLLAAPSYGIVMQRRLPKELLLIFGAIPCVVFFLPDSVLNAVSAPFGMTPGFSELRRHLSEALDIFVENMAIGIGAQGFDAEAALPTNLLLGLGCRFGIIALAIFAALVLIRLRQISVYSRFLRHSQLMPLSAMTALATFAFMVLGWFFDLFGDMSLYCLFFVLFGMNTAALRTSKREYDDRHDYYGDQRALDVSNIDVILR